MPLPQSEGVQRALKHAYHAAGRYKRRQVHTEHLLLGLLHERGSAVRLLTQLGHKRDDLRHACERLCKTGTHTLEDCIRLTIHAQNIMTFAAEEAKTLGHDEIDTRHVLLGMVREEEGIAGEVLRNAGVTADALRAALAAPDAERAARKRSRSQPSAPHHSRRPTLWQRLKNRRFQQD